MRVKDLKVGKQYAYQDIEALQSEDVYLNEYGKDFLGEGAIHLVHRDTFNYWFILDSCGNSYYYKLVYTN